MKKKVIFVIFLSLIINLLFCRNVQMYNITFIDESRDYREIPTVIFYPNDENNDSNFDPYPFAVFGHGWLMNYNNYQSITNFMVSQNWIIAFPRTEEGLFPSHLNFALDLVFLNNAIMEEGDNPLSPLFGMVKPLSMLMGHSMGGGASVLAAANIDNNYDSLVTFAAANTNPSAILAANDVSVPSITFSAPGDNITPPENHQTPIYENLGSVYKSFVSLIGESHFSLTSSQNAFDTLSYWMSFFLQDSALTDFEFFLESLSDSVNYSIENTKFALAIGINRENSGNILIDGHQVNAPIFFNEGSAILINAENNQGFGFLGWFQDGVLISSGHNLEFVMPDEHFFIISNFYMYGDINRDNEVTPLDASAILQYYVGFDPIPEIDPLPWSEKSLLIADVDLDGYILPVDAALILQYYVGLIEELPIVGNYYPAETQVIKPKNFNSGKGIDFYHRQNR